MAADNDAFFESTETSEAAFEIIRRTMKAVIDIGYWIEVGLWTFFGFIIVAVSLLFAFVIKNMMSLRGEKEDEDDDEESKDDEDDEESGEDEDDEEDEEEDEYDEEESDEDEDDEESKEDEDE